MAKRTVVLMILDGWGIGPENEGNPVHVVNPPNFAFLKDNYPMTSLGASGISVGLPWGEVGNSEVGHLTLGAGKVVYQYYPKITMAVEDGTFYENPVLKSAFDHAKKNNSAVNLVGLLTKAHTHASIEHLDALLKMAEKEGISKVNLHLFADGIDSSPKSVFDLLAQIPKEKLATLTGRYYAMDRNEHWDLTQKTFECLTGKGGAPTTDLKSTLDLFFTRNASEEFLPPLTLRKEGAIGAKDAVVFINFREDSIRQIAETFTAPSFTKFTRELPPDLYVATMTHYADHIIAPAAFPADKVEKCLGEVLSAAGRNQLRLAETYKYAHVTYFFNGHREEPYKNEYRALVPSLPLTHPEEKPELMAGAITDRLLEAIQNQAFDFVLVNYSNPDTLGHTGNYAGCLEAVKVIDRELGKILKAIEGTPTVLLVTADHGNIEEVLNPATGTVETEHDANPVPFHIVAPEVKGRRFPNQDNLRLETLGLLSDVAPTVLEIMEIEPPREMNGKSLLQHII